jgi:hypothetical protein
MELELSGHRYRPKGKPLGKDIITCTPENIDTNRGPGAEITMFYANSCSFAQHLRQECTTNFTQGL